MVGVYGGAGRSRGVCHGAIAGGTERAKRRCLWRLGALRMWLLPNRVRPLRCKTPSAAQKTKSDSLLTALEAQNFAAFVGAVFHATGRPHFALKANKGQDADAFMAVGEALVSALLAVDKQADRGRKLSNTAGLRCGTALLDCYQQ